MNNKFNKNEKRFLMTISLPPEVRQRLVQVKDEIGIPISIQIEKSLKKGWESE